MAGGARRTSRCRARRRSAPKSKRKPA